MFSPSVRSVGVETDTLTGVTTTLKSLAADPFYRTAFVAAPILRDTFTSAAERYIVAGDRAGLWPRLDTLTAKGYRTGIEYVGEDATDPDEIEANCQEYLALIEAMATGTATRAQLGFDLSNVGLLCSRELAVRNTARILRAAASLDVSVIISMERSPLVDSIVDVFCELAAEHPNVGLTVQAHLHRTPSDLAAVAKHGRKIRLVKGVYRESTDVALRRGAELNRRYAELAHDLLDRGVPLAVGTHDATLLDLLERQGITSRITEIEMLHGSRPTLLRRWRDKGVPCRVACVYGENWWLHFLHRLAEYPPNVLTALADLAEPGRVQFGADY